MQTPWATADSLAALHACRTQEGLEAQFAEGLARMLPGVDAALCLHDEASQQFVVRVCVGEDHPLKLAQVVCRDDWPVPASQRLPLTFQGHVIGELWISKSLAGAVRAALEDALTHLSVALVNLTLNSEAREASTEYCATLQALEEGIVLFQESDPDAMTARMLTLASSMVNATAGALYVLDEVGNRESGLVLQQTLGVPEPLMASCPTPRGAARTRRRSRAAALLANLTLRPYGRWVRASDLASSTSAWGIRMAGRLRP